jgi:hypothetical protein
MPPYLPLKERLPRKPKMESQSQKESKLKEAGLSEIRISAFTEGGGSDPYPRCRRRGDRGQLGQSAFIH